MSPDYIEQLVLASKLRPHAPGDHVKRLELRQPYALSFPTLMLPTMIGRDIDRRLAMHKPRTPNDVQDRVHRRNGRTG